MRRHTDEIKIAVSAALFCGVMLLIYVVVPQSIRIPTATTTLKEAPATAAEAEAATGSASSGSDFPIYNQESNYQDNPQVRILPQIILIPLTHHPMNRIPPIRMVLLMK